MDVLVREVFLLRGFFLCMEVLLCMDVVNYSCQMLILIV
jgi:hypothetical protein